MQGLLLEIIPFPHLELVKAKLHNFQFHVIFLLLAKYSKYFIKCFFFFISLLCLQCSFKLIFKC